jgi:hypothetical protein
MHSIAHVPNQFSSPPHWFKCVDFPANGPVFLFSPLQYGFCQGFSQSWPASVPPCLTADMSLCVHTRNQMPTTGAGADRGMFVGQMIPQSTSLRPAPHGVDIIVLTAVQPPHTCYALTEMIRDNRLECRQTDTRVCAQTHTFTYTHSACGQGYMHTFGVWTGIWTQEE